ncbi:MAG TPA: flagellar export protein FliJ [Spirochaetales bacterium]|nr:flagellar export protein FliJ [Spirochaetales bacterium]HPM72397.1 flagellar export protein FliJ [Spirochaetales bacterium]
MRSFAFKLERVLELREYDEKVAEAVLGEKTAVCSRLTLALEANARAAVEAARERFRPGSDASDHRAGELYAVRLSQERERLFKSLAAAELEREAARVDYVEATKARRLVTKLREREEAVYYKAVAREETKAMDDLAAGAHARADAR